MSTKKQRQEGLGAVLIFPTGPDSEISFLIFDNPAAASRGFSKIATILTQAVAKGAPFKAIREKSRIGVNHICGLPVLERPPVTKGFRCYAWHPEEQVVFNATIKKRFIKDKAERLRLQTTAYEAMWTARGIYLQAGAGAVALLSNRRKSRSRPVKKPDVRTNVSPDCESKNPKRAIPSCSKIIAGDSGNARAYHFRANGYQRAGKYKRANEDYAEAIRLDPTFPSAYFNRGLSYFKTDDYGRAIADFNAALRRNPKHSKAHAMLGTSYLKMGQPARAVENYDKALQIKPDDDYSVKWRAKALAKLNAPQQLHCVHLYYPRRRRKTLHYSYRLCPKNGTCTDEWKEITLEYQGRRQGSAKAHCWTLRKPQKFQIAYDWSSADGYQKRVDELTPHAFEYRGHNVIPSTGCSRKGAYHFINTRRKLRVRSGRPRRIRAGSCTWRVSK